MLTSPAVRPAAAPAPGPTDKMFTTPCPELPPRPARPRKRISRGTAGWLGRGILVTGLGMIPWAFVLASMLPSTTTVDHWPQAWAGLDAMEAAGLITTGMALILRYRWLSLPAAVTSTLLVVDAWFDITTSAPGSAVTVAIAMATFLELPVAGLCAVLSVCNAPRYSSRSHPTEIIRRASLERWRLDAGADIGEDVTEVQLPCRQHGRSSARRHAAGDDGQSARRLPPSALDSLTPSTTVQDSSSTTPDSVWKHTVATNSADMTPPD